MFQRSPVEAEAYRAPSEEALRIVRRAPWLASPPEGRPGLLGWLGLRALIAPMTQLTFFSFDLQAFLFVVFHRSRVTLLGHALFMTTENLFLMAALRGLPVARLPWGTVDGGMLHAGLLLVWCAAVAFRARLCGWFAVTAPIVVLLYLASGPLAALFHDRLHLSPGWGVAASAFLVALSHAGEPLLPPRTVDRFRWVPLREHLFERGLGLGPRLLRILHMGVLLVIGTVGEAWASLRLMHYNWLMLLMRLGYAPERRAELLGWAERAWATGNPALDFVGTGGGTFLAPPRGGPPEASSMKDARPHG